MTSPISKAETDARDRLANNGRNPTNKNAGIRVGSDLHLCEMLLAEIDALRSWKQARLECNDKDQARLDWLQGRIVDTIYLDDGKIVDVRGNDLRKAIDEATQRWPNSLEDDDGEEKFALTAADGGEK